MSDKFGKIVNTHPSGDFELTSAAERSGVDISGEGQVVFNSVIEALPHLGCAEARAVLDEIEDNVKTAGRTVG